MKIFMTGATGWVGSHLLPELIDGGHEITALARSDKAIEKLERQGVKAIRGSLEDKEVLDNAAKEADIVVHLAYIHDFSDKTDKAAQTDFAAIRTLCSALEGTNKVFIGTSGISGLTGGQTETDKAAYGYRQQAENIAYSFNSKGVKTIMIRLSPSVHGEGDPALIKWFIEFTRSKGYAAVIEEGENSWSGVHVKDVARLYKIVVENNGGIPGGTILHASENDGNAYKFKDIQSLIASRLGIHEVRHLKDEDEINDYFGGLAYFARLDVNPQTKITRKLTGWEPRENTLLEDVESGFYFK